MNAARAAGTRAGYPAGPGANRHVQHRAVPEGERAGQGGGQLLLALLVQLILAKLFGGHDQERGFASLAEPPNLGEAGSRCVPFTISGPTPEEPSTWYSSCG